MAPLTEPEIDAIARRIVADLRGEVGPREGGLAAADPSLGLFASVDEAVEAAGAAQPVFVRLPLARRAAIVAAMRASMLERAEELARIACDETGMGRIEDKVLKNRLVAEKTAGLEDLVPRTVTGDHGLTLVEPAPYGVIGAITPSTNPAATIICNAIAMLAAGNSVVFNVHPAAVRCSLRTVALLNQTIIACGGPPNVVTCLTEPSIESAQETMRHPGVRLLVVTGGGAVVKAALASGKRAVCAGPGNPPVVVDETADIGKAARDIVLGASCDNNIICTDEKEVLCCTAIADELLAAMARSGAVVLDRRRLLELEKLVFATSYGPRRPGVVNKDLIGKNASTILAHLGISAPEELRLVVVEVDEGHPLLWTEQMMPVMPLCRVADAGAAIDLAVAVEGGNRHTAVMHSKNIDHLSRMARECDCSIFVKNGRSQAGLGLDGEGTCSFTIASPTGEGMTGPRSFSRWRRCVLVDHFRIT
jgi:acyl-CoA reductase-like NAD-dependent aldehyde dehydrogenase